MPRTKTRATNKLSKQSSAASITIGTQTENEESNNELSNCLKMIELLKLEIIELKKDTQLLKNQSFNTEEKKLLESVSDNKDNNEKSQKPSKGCTCKGNCSSKLCGCIKKDMICNTNLCKCNATKCKNQESEKENAVPVVISETPSTSKMKKKLYTENSNETVNIHHSENKNESDTRTVKFVSEPKLLRGNSSTGSNIDEIIDTCLNPMVPNYQLPRTPHKSEDTSLNLSVPQHQLARSPVKSEENVIASSKEKHFSPLEEVLAAEKIDWDKHKAELVVCKMCNRRFFPNRIDKHVKSCKKI